MPMTPAILEMRPRMRLSPDSGKLLEPTGVDGSQTADLDIGPATFPSAAFAGWASGRKSGRGGRWSGVVALWDGNAFNGISIVGGSDDSPAEAAERALGDHHESVGGDE
jgi:hypothetical protein